MYSSVGKRGMGEKHASENLKKGVGVLFWGANLEKTRGFLYNCHNRQENAWPLPIVNPITIILI
jgi:hypothetical protein